MTNTSTENLHFEHKIWSSEIAFYSNEINFLKKTLSDSISKFKNTEVKIKAEKYLNHLDHNLRFLIALKETIETHELFMREMMETVSESDDIELNEYESGNFEDSNLTDHDKTGKHLKKFRKRYGKLKDKIIKIVSSKS